jgi:hypothetical protein
MGKLAMPYTIIKEFRDCCLAVRNGDDAAAARQILRLYGYGALADEIRKGKPFSNQVRQCLDALTAGCGTHWERPLSNGNFEQLLMQPPPPPGTIKNWRHY